MRKGLILVVLGCLGCMPVSAQWFVDADNAGLQNGFSWATAFTEIQDAIDAANTVGGGEVWVAEGTYDEARALSSGALQLRDGVDVYGGFAGTESALSERNWYAHLTVIDGSTARSGNAAYHVVAGADNATIDGFTLTGGQATSFVGEGATGGGMYNNAVSPTVSNCIFLDNAARRGAGMYNAAGAQPWVLDCSFARNDAVDYGGGMYNYGATTTPVVRRCVFSLNTAGDHGGAIYNYLCNAEMSSSLFTNNTAVLNGGAICNRSTPAGLKIGKCVFLANGGTNGGAVYTDTNDCQFSRCVFIRNSVTAGGGALYNAAGLPAASAALNDSVFLNNGAANGGAIYNADGASAYSIQCSFTQNQVTGTGGAVYSVNQTATALTAANCIFWEDASLEIYGAASVTYSDVDGGLAGLGNIDAYPSFTNVNAANLRLNNISPCIGTALNNAATASDIVGVTRPEPVGWGSIVDMGAYEYKYSAGTALNAEFSADVASGVAPLTVHFTDASTTDTESIAGWLWDFGDGGTSREQHPTHTYTTEGSFTVVLQTVKTSGVDYEIKPAYIAVSASPTANFSANPYSGAAPLTVQFTDESAPGSAPLMDWSWDFDNNGTEDSTLPDPQYTYTVPGTYSVALTVTSSLPASDTELKVDVITVLTPPTAAFSASPLIGPEPLTVQFTDESAPGDAPITQWSWDFDNDGIEDSAEPSPEYTYPAPGIYTVSLTVTTSLASDTETKTDYVEVQALPTAAFSASGDAGYTPYVVQFTDESDPGSLPITDWSWDFNGDSTEDSDEPNPEHTYTAPGLYVVTLTVTTGVGSDFATPMLIRVGDPIVFNEHPADMLHYVGESGAFRVDVSGGYGEVHYQWKFEDGQKTLIDVGNDQPLLNIDVIGEGHEGEYWCVVSDEIMDHPSNHATLGVAPPLQITTQPQSAERFVWETYTFAVGTEGGFEPLTYQWWKGEAPLAGQTGPVYDLPELSLADTGEYKVIVADAHTSVLTSDTATLFVDDGLPAAGLAGLALLTGLCALAGIAASRRR